MYFENSRSFHSIVTLITVHKKKRYDDPDVFCLSQTRNTSRRQDPTTVFPSMALPPGIINPFHSNLFISLHFAWFSFVLFIVYFILVCCFASCDKGFEKLLIARQPQWLYHLCFDHHQHLAQPPLHSSVFNILLKLLPSIINILLNLLPSIISNLLPRASSGRISPAPPSNLPQAVGSDQVLFPCLL